LKLRTAFKLTANLETVAFRHHHIQKDHAGPHGVDRFLDAQRIVETNRLIAFVFEEALHELHLSRRVVHDEHFLQHEQKSPELSEARRCTSAATFGREKANVSESRKAQWNHSVRAADSQVRSGSVRFQKFLPSQPEMSSQPRVSRWQALRNAA